MTRRDLSYILRERKRRADPQCANCDGDGTVSYFNGAYTDVEAPCPCLMRAGDFSEPDPLADESQSDARELARDRS